MLCPLLAVSRLAPGPDYRLYLSPKFVETEADFELLKPEMVQVGLVQTFENFMVAVPESVDPGEFNAAIVWCESFGQFITAAAYQQTMVMSEPPLVDGDPSLKY